MKRSLSASDWFVWEWESALQLRPSQEALRGELADLLGDLLDMPKAQSCAILSEYRTRAMMDVEYQLTVHLRCKIGPRWRRSLGQRHLARVVAAMGGGKRLASIVDSSDDLPVKKSLDEHVDLDVHVSRGPPSRSEAKIFEHGYGSLKRLRFREPVVEDRAQTSQDPASSWRGDGVPCAQVGAFQVRRDQNSEVMVSNAFSQGQANSQANMSSELFCVKCRAIFVADSEGRCRCGATYIFERCSGRRSRLIFRILGCAPAAKGQVCDQQ